MLDASDHSHPVLPLSHRDARDAQQYAFNPRKDRVHSVLGIGWSIGSQCCTYAMKCYKVIAIRFSNYL